MRFLKYKRIVKEIPADARSFGPAFALAKLQCIWTDERIDSVQRKNRAILNYLYAEYKPLLETYQTVRTTTESRANAPVWTMWWDGEMPEVIEMCWQSKLRSAGTHPVNMITKENVAQYISFPDEVWNQFYSGKLRIQHLADMIRVQLIRKYGGIWLDASIYCNGRIPEEYFQMPLYSIRGSEDPRFVSNNQWTTFAIGGHPENVLCGFLDDFFRAYCLTGKPFMDYYLFDCAIALAHRHLPAARNCLDALPKAEWDCYWLNAHLERPAAENDCANIPLFSKISWGRFVNQTPAEGTLYKLLLKESYRGS